MDIMQTSNTLIKIALPCAGEDEANKYVRVCYKSSSATSLFSFPFFCNESSRKNYSSFKQNRRENVKEHAEELHRYNVSEPHRDGIRILKIPRYEKSAIEYSYLCYLNLKFEKFLFMDLINDLLSTLQISLSLCD